MTKKEKIAFSFISNIIDDENPENIVLLSSLDLQFVEVLNPRNVQIKLQRYMVKKVPI